MLIPTLFPKNPLLNLQINRPPALHKLTGETMTLNYWAVSFIGRLRIVPFFRPTPYTNETRFGLIRFRNFARGRSTVSIASLGTRGLRRYCDEFTLIISLPHVPGSVGSLYNSVSRELIAVESRVV